MTENFEIPDLDRLASELKSGNCLSLSDEFNRIPFEDRLVEMNKLASMVNNDPKSAARLEVVAMTDGWGEEHLYNVQCTGSQGILDIYDLPGEISHMDGVPAARKLDLDSYDSYTRRQGTNRGFRLEKQ